MPEHIIYWPRAIFCDTLPGVTRLPEKACQQRGPDAICQVSRSKAGIAPLEVDQAHLNAHVTILFMVPTVLTILFVVSRVLKTLIMVP